MYIKSFKELKVWQKSILLVKEVYEISAKFPKNEVYCLIPQIRRCAISIPSNIAEGQKRKNLKEYLQFLRISFGSSAELETQILIAKMLYKTINFSKAESLLLEVQKMLNVMIYKLENKSKT